jgi:hypothetical protein
VSQGAVYIQGAVQGDSLSIASWGDTLTTIGLVTSMAVNALMTGLIVFKILKVFLEFKPTSVERTLGSSTGGSKLQHILFIVIESGMALFAIQLVRVVLSCLDLESVFTVIGIHEMLNVIVHFYFLLLY